MKSHYAKDQSSIQKIIDYLNGCHDGWIRRIIFIKDRKYEIDNSISCPSEEDGGMILCEIQMELLLDSYIGALPHQIVMLTFTGVNSFNFFQKNSYDYSEIYELKFKKINESSFEFFFQEPSKNKFIILTIICASIKCDEYTE